MIKGDTIGAQVNPQATVVVNAVATHTIVYRGCIDNCHPMPTIVDNGVCLIRCDPADDRAWGCINQDPIFGIWQVGGASLIGADPVALDYVIRRGRI